MKKNIFPTVIDTVSIKTPIPTGTGLELMEEEFKIVKLDRYAIHIRGLLPNRYEERTKAYASLLRILKPEDINTSNRQLYSTLIRLFNDGRKEITF